jgi:hypothetical protein
LTVVMQQAHGKLGSFCGAIALAIRSVPATRDLSMTSAMAVC